MSVRTKVTYQGYDGVAIDYRRSFGFSPEPGAFTCDFSVFRKLVVVQRGVPFRGANGVAINCGTSIHAWKQNLDKISKLSSTITDDGLAGIPAPKGGGFNLFGDLVLQSWIDGDELSPMTYKDVYVDISGIEELARNLKDIRKHDRGYVVVPLTDIRAYYPRYSPLLCSINVPWHKPKWRPDTVRQDAKGNPLNEPYPFLDVYEFLLSQLPGCPRLVAGAEIRELKLDPPTSIIGRGQPAIEELQKLTERNGLVPQFLPNGNYAVSKRGSKRYSYGKISIGVNQSKSAADDRYETLTQNTTRRPPLVNVVGERRLRRRVTIYEAALRDTDGNWYDLPTISKRYNYPLSKINRGVAVGGDRACEDLPIAGAVSSKTAQEWNARREVLSKAYRTWIPRHLFEIAARLAKQSAGKGAQLTGRAAVGPDAFALNPYKPTKAPMYLSELRDLGIKLPDGAIPLKGDRGEYVLAEPIIRGGRIAQDLFPNWDDFEEHFNGLYIKPVDFELSKLEARKQAKVKQGQSHADSLKRPETQLEALVTAEGSRRLGFARFGSQLKLTEIGKAQQQAAELVGIHLHGDMRIFETDNNASALTFIESIVAEIKQIDEQIKNLRDAKLKAEKDLDEWRPVYKKVKGIPLWMNRPVGLLSLARLQPSGVLESPVPLCQMAQPFVTNPEKATIVNAAAVHVVHGYEIDDNSPSDWTLLQFMAGPDDAAGIPSIVVCGGFGSSPIAGLTVPFEGRLVEDEDGNPMNLSAITTQAVGKAAEELRIPLTTDGWTYDFSGLRRAWLDGGVVSVQHTWDGRSKDAPAKTHVAVNAPMSRYAPLGPAIMPRPSTGRSDAVEWA